MNFLAPLAFALAALLPVIIALYFLKLRREEYRVSSTYLWRTLIRDAAANAPWQRLRPNLLLLLQLLFLIALIFALARPFTWGTAAASSHLILVIDTSASMGATDLEPNRLAAAVASARQLIDGLPSSARVTVIEAGVQARVPVSGASDPGAALAALETLRPGPAGADFDSALTLAAAVAAREPDSEVVILSDGHIQLPNESQLTLPGRVSYVSIGEDNTNQAINTFSVQAESGGRSLTAFVQVVNYGLTSVQRRLVLYADGQLLSARDVRLPPGVPQAFSLPGLPPDARVLEAQLEGSDRLAVDDSAWTVSAASDRIVTRIASPGNRFLETALGLLPNVEVALVKPEELATLTANATSDLGGLTILDAFVPTTTLPAGNLLFIAPPRSTELFSVTGQLEAPVLGPVAVDDPLLRYVDLRDVAVQDATRLALPSWGRAAIVDGKTGAPLLVIGEQDGRRIGVLAFDLRRSDLPLRVAFPVLMANLIDALVPGGASGIPPAAEPGQTVALPAPPQAGTLSVQAPDGQVYRLTPSEGRVLFEQTDASGVYEVSWQDQTNQSQTLGRFAVNLFNAHESDITPRETLPIVSVNAGADDQTLPRGRDEWWRPIAWLALILLVAEWLLSHRGQLARLLRNVAPLKS